MAKKKKLIKTKSLSRFLKSEYEMGIKNKAINEDLSFDEFKDLFKKAVNTCQHCGVKYWNELRCKCDLI